VNIGLRYELNTVVKDKNGQMGNFDPIRGLVQTNNPYNGDHNNFAPRLGFAWDMFGTGKTVLRVGGGIMYESFSFDVMNGEGNLLGLRTFPTGLPLVNGGNPTPITAGGNIQLQSLTLGGPQLTALNKAWRNFNPGAPVAGQATIFASAIATPACGDGFTNPNPTVFASAPTGCEIYGVDPNLRTPYVNNWNIDIQHAITNNLSIDIGYVGNHGSKLLGKLNINQPAPFSGWSTPLNVAAVDNDGYCAAVGANPCNGGSGTTDVGKTPAQVCLGQGVEALGTCVSSPTLEQASLPFTAPCSGGIIESGTGHAIGENLSHSGGIFNPTGSCFSYLSYITMIHNIYNSNYNGLQMTLMGRNYHGLSFTAGYTYSHALGDASDQGTSANFPVPTNSYGNIRQQLYANTDFDIRHRFSLSLDYMIPGKKGFGQMLEGWAVNSVVIVTSGLPWGASDQTSDFSGTNVVGTGAQSFGEPWNFFGNPKDFTPVHGWSDTNGGGWTQGGGGVPCFGFGNPNCGPTIPSACSTADTTAYSGQQQALAIASLTNLGCYVVGSSVMVPAPYGSYGNMKANIFRDNGFKNVDFSVTKTFVWRERFKAEARVEIFNILNKINFSNPSGGPGGAIQDPTGQPFGFVGLTPDSYSSNPQLGSGGERAMQLGLKLSW
jgi:hypothetical protein